ncbi:MAG TPA: SURF1 family protein [Gemmatimonadaceae bacterium]|nr:SURF1 family protein [Gemmatimonadaceae bacterium]
MRPTRYRSLLTIAVPLVCAAVFARLGIWQLARLSERRAFNTILEARLDSPPVPVSALNPDTSVGHYRRVSASGRYSYDREVAYAGRSRRGSPGVNLLTPLKLAGTDTVVLVNRGWVYSPDARAVEHARWREGDSTSVSGYAETFASKAGNTAVQPDPPALGDSVRLVHTLNRTVLERAIGLPVAPYLFVQISDSTLHLDSIPVRLTLPALDEGPHAAYAVQWFSFATIAMVGGALLFRAQRPS